MKAHTDKILRGLGSVHDILMAGIALTVAHSLIWGLDRAADNHFYLQLSGFMLLCAVIFPLFSLNRGTWRYASLLDIASIVKAVSTAILIFVIGNFLANRGASLPRSVPIITWFILIIMLGGPRLVYRLWKEGRQTKARRQQSASMAGAGNALLIGFNDNSDLLLRTIRRSAIWPWTILGIIDEKKKNLRRRLHGIKVVGTLEDLPELVAKYRRQGIPVGQLIVTDLNLSQSMLGSIIETASQLGLPLSRIPDISNTPQLRSDAIIETKPLQLEDLLGRPRNELENHGLETMIEDKVVLVTGGGGSIGLELCSQIARCRPRLLVVADLSELNLYTAEIALTERSEPVNCAFRLIDVRSQRGVEGLFAEFSPEIVFHAAALKHLPIVEDNPLEGIHTNVLGTKTVADAAKRHESQSFVLISTDKAVNPTSVMGASKKAAEIYCQSLDSEGGKTRFIAVRFGNVLGSTGSVIPRFNAQLKRGGPLTVTHAEMTRYFMTIAEATRLVLESSVSGTRVDSPRGQIYVLDMGQPVLISQLAEQLIQLAGLRPHIDIQIQYIGLRKGEKLHEELFSASDRIRGEGSDGFLVASPQIIEKSVLDKTMESLKEAVHDSDRDRAIRFLQHIVADFSPYGSVPSAPIDEITSPAVVAESETGAD